MGFVLRSQVMEQRITALSFNCRSQGLLPEKYDVTELNSGQLPTTFVTFNNVSTVLLIKYTLKSKVIES